MAFAAGVDREIIERGAEDLGVDLESLISIEMDAWDEEDCPLCKAGVSINTEKIFAIPKFFILVSLLII